MCCIRHQRDIRQGKAQHGGSEKVHVCHSSMLPFVRTWFMGKTLGLQYALYVSVLCVVVMSRMARPAGVSFWMAEQAEGGTESRACVSYSHVHTVGHDTGRAFVWVHRARACMPWTILVRDRSGAIRMGPAHRSHNM